ncbi:hypothetical protein MBANPS3_012640, partial [Mucor bainieri]
MSVASSRRSSVHYHHESPVSMEDTEHFDIATSPPLIVLEEVTLEPMSYMPIEETPPSSDFAMSPSSTEDEDAAMGTVEAVPVVVTEDQGTQTELEDTTMIEEVPAVATKDQDTQTEDIYIQHPPSEMQDALMSDDPTQSIPATTTSPSTQDPVVLTEPSPSKDAVDIDMETSEVTQAEQPSQPKDMPSVTTTSGLSASEQDSIVAKLMEAIRKEKQETLEAEKKKQETPPPDPAPIPDPKQPPPQEIKDPSSSRAHMKRPMKRDSDSDPDSNDGDVKIKGVPGVTLGKVGANVNEPIDMP